MTDAEAAAWMREVAEDFANRARASQPDDAQPMDLTPPSLPLLDDVARGFGYSEEVEQGVVPALGAYLGEVVVRAGGGRWAATPEHDIVLVTRTGYAFFPRDAVRARTQHAEEPELDHVFSYAMAGAPVPTEEVYASGMRFGADLQRAMWSWGALCAAERSVWGIELDFSPTSLDVLDEECDSLDPDTLSEDAWGYYQLTMGGYLGEVVRGSVGGTWVNTPHGIGLQIKQQSTCFPLGKVEKRILNGPADSLSAFHESTLSIMADDRIV